MPLPTSRKCEYFTYADYLTWPEGERWEIINGEAFAMSPAPGKRHQQISGELFRQLANYLKGKPCLVFAAPFDVRFSERAGLTDEKVGTVVQPDIFVVCDKSKLDERGCNGPPDYIVEISSSSTSKVDLTKKFDLYQQHGVREYWIIHPAEQTLLVYKIENDGLYGKPDRYACDDKVPVPLLGDLEVDLVEVFAE